MLIQSNSRKQAESYVQQLVEEQKAQLPTQREESVWIHNEGLLRDEGSLFGIAGAEITDKLSAIASYYESRKAAHLQKKIFLDHQIAAAKELIQLNRAEVKGMKENHEQKLEMSYSLRHILPVSLQCIAIVTVCFFNYFLVRYWLSPVIQSDIICVGIYLFGLFSVFIGRGVMNNLSNNILDDDELVKGVRWKLYIKEFGVATIAAFFICTITFTAYPIRNSIAGFLMLIMLFLCGKVFINSVFSLRKQLTSYLSFVKARNRLHKTEKQLLRSTAEAETTIEEALKELQDPETILKTLQAEQDYKTYVFLSEYKLAFESRKSLNKLTAKQFA